MVTAPIHTCLNSGSLSVWQPWAPHVGRMRQSSPSCDIKEGDILRAVCLVCFSSWRTANLAGEFAGRPAVLCCFWFVVICLHCRTFLGPCTMMFYCLCSCKDRARVRHRPYSRKKTSTLLSRSLESHTCVVCHHRLPNFGNCCNTQAWCKGAGDTPPQHWRVL